jgi:uncharacterized protein YbjQ (UPF0145 family)
MIVSTTNDVCGYRIVRHLGLVRGITVRSRSVLGNFAGAVHRRDHRGSRLRHRGLG